jgi:hypothetical protein
MRGNLNVLVETGTFAGNITPFCIWHCGTVGDMKGYLTPLEKAGDIKDENPDKEVMFCVENLNRHVIWQ